MSLREPFPVRASRVVAILIGATIAGLGCGRVNDETAKPAPRLESDARPLIALSRSGWTATASATASMTSPANVFDDNPATRWSIGANQAAEQYFQVDMVSVRSFVELTMDTSQTPSDFPKAFRVNVSNDGASWGNPIATGVGAVPIVAVSFAPQAARFVRVTLTGSATTSWSIHEFNVLSNTLSRTGWSATASTTNGTNDPSKAIDGALSTAWTSMGPQTGQNFLLNMSARQTFNQIVLNSGGNAPNNYPRSYSVAVSNDGTTFGPVVASGTATASPVVIDLPNQFAQFVKITAGSDSAPWTIADLVVNGQPTTQFKLPRSGWTATATSMAANGTNPPAGALDGATSTRWSSNGPQTGQSFTVDMLTFRTFNQITLDAGTTSSAPSGA